MQHLCWIGRGTHIRGTQHDNKLQHGHTQQDINGTVITCVHTCHLWDSHVFTLFVCGMQRIHKHKKVGFALTESLPPPNIVAVVPRRAPPLPRGATGARGSKAHTMGLLGVKRTTLHLSPSLVAPSRPLL